MNMNTNRNTNKNNKHSKHLVIGTADSFYIFY